MSEKLQDFHVASKEEWLRQVRKELKGDDPSKLHWNHPELGDLPPYFNREDRIEPLPMPPRSISVKSGEWEIVQRFSARHNNNTSVLKALADGCSGLRLNLETSASPDELQPLLKNVYLNMISVHLDGSPEHVISALQWLSSSTNALTGAAGIDAMGMTIEQIHGDLDATTLVKHYTSVKALQQRVRSIEIRANKVFEAGGGDALEVAYAVHNAQWCLEVLLESGISLDDAAAEFQFSLSAGQSYFVTLAKFRALRYIWAKVISEYNPQHDCSLVTWIHGITSQRHYGTRDVNTNLLRNTTAAMAAIAGGCDSLEVSDHTPWKINENSRRWARNIHHLLAEESGFGMVIDQGAGSYYIEFLTQRIIEKVIDYLGAFEDRGGLMEEEGRAYFLKTLSEHRSALIKRWVDATDKVVGSNIYPPNEDNSVQAKWPETNGSPFDPINCASILQNHRQP